MDHGGHLRKMQSDILAAAALALGGRCARWAALRCPKAPGEALNRIVEIARRPDTRRNPYRLARTPVRQYAAVTSMRSMRSMRSMNGFELAEDVDQTLRGASWRTRDGEDPRFALG